jgi:uncharacterized membrane protein YheB (UPF0754 family)
MLDTLITSKTRIKLLLKFFLNGNTQSYLRNLELEFNESTNGIRQELNKFEEAGLLQTSVLGNKKLFKANVSHPLFKDIQNILMKYTGLDQILEEVVGKLGDVKEVFLVGELGKGIDNSVIDLVFVGNINKTYLTNLTEKVEKLIHRKIKYIVYSPDEFLSIRDNILQEKPLLLWSNDKQ